MNEFFENLGKKISETADVVGKTAEDVFDNVSQKTGEVIEEQKLKSKVRGLEKENRAAFLKMGQKLYEDFKAGYLEDVQFADSCREIEERDESILDYKKQIAEVKGYELCGKCHAHIQPNTVYCPKCGAKVEEVEF